jgi:hypothetical protein
VGLIDHQCFNVCFFYLSFSKNVLKILLLRKFFKLFNDEIFPPILKKILLYFAMNLKEINNHFDNMVIINAKHILKIFKYTLNEMFTLCLKFGLTKAIH